MTYFLNVFILMNVPFYVTFYWAESSNLSLAQCQSIFSIPSCKIFSPSLWRLQRYKVHIFLSSYSCNSCYLILEKNSHVPLVSLLYLSFQTCGETFICLTTKTLISEIFWLFKSLIIYFYVKFLLDCVLKSTSYLYGFK